MSGGRRVDRIRSTGPPPRARPARGRRPTGHRRPTRRYRPARGPGAGARDRGSSIVELAILWPIVVLAVFGAVQITTYFTARTLALSAAQAGVSAERRYDAVPGVGQQRAEEFLATAGDWLVHAEVDAPVRTDEEVFITVRGEALSVLPGVTWRIAQTARGTVERFTEAP